MAKVTQSPMLLNHYHLLDKLRRQNAVMVYRLLRNGTRFQLRDFERATFIVAVFHPKNTHFWTHQDMECHLDGALLRDKISVERL